MWKLKLKPKTNRWMSHSTTDGQRGSPSRPERERGQCSIPISSPTCLSGKKGWVVISLCLLETLQHSISMCPVGGWETKDLRLCFWEVHAVASWGRLEFFFFFWSCGENYCQSRPTGNRERGANCWTWRKRKRKHYFLNPDCFCLFSDSVEPPSSQVTFPARPLL